jgi:hypothetical protein
VAMAAVVKREEYKEFIRRAQTALQIGAYSSLPGRRLGKGSNGIGHRCWKLARGQNSRSDVSIKGGCVF